MKTKNKKISPKDMSPKAREAFGRSLIDIGVTIYKGLFLVVTVVPISFILKNVFLEGEKFTLIDLFQNFSFGAYVLFFVFAWLSLWAAHTFRYAGLVQIHEVEVEQLIKKPNG